MTPRQILAKRPHEICVTVSCQAQFDMPTVAYYTKSDWTWLEALPEVLVHIICPTIKSGAGAILAVLPHTFNPAHVYPLDAASGFLASIKPSPDDESIEQGYQRYTKPSSTQIKIEQLPRWMR